MYTVVPIGNPEYGLARDWIGQFSTAIRAPDALHLAVAMRGNLVLATADRGLARAAAEIARLREGWNRALERAKGWAHLEQLQ
ncbi:MAG: hypothetical protein U1E05_12440 [Patescibacteria group bacterium]|nr:hypothetical protein [Patescibacteria group bacterium]